MRARAKNGLKVREIWVPVNHGNLNRIEARMLQESLKFGLGKTEPAVEIKFPGFLKPVPLLIQDYD